MKLTFVKFNQSQLLTIFHKIAPSKFLVPGIRRCFEM